MTPSRLRPELIATLELPADPATATPTAHAQPPPPSEGQLDALDELVDALDEELVAKLLDNHTEIRVVLRRPVAGERWARVK